MAFPSREEENRLKRLGWVRMGINVPPQVRRIMESESRWNQKSMSAFIWEVVAALYLKAHGMAGKTLPELNAALEHDLDLRAQGHKRIGEFVHHATAEKQRLYEELLEIRMADANAATMEAESHE